jgi:hypothetical protein
MKSHCKSNKHNEYPEYRVWSGMRNRCNNVNEPCYHRYGGRGIKICERWSDFDSFFADMGARPEGASLERIDNDKDYSPENCRWATVTEQANNRRTSRLLEYKGQTYTLAQLSRLCGIATCSINYRLKRGMTVEQAVEMPIQNTGAHVTLQERLSA